MVAELQTLPTGGDNPWMQPNHPQGVPLSVEDPFRPGAMALVTLGNPREKFWGVILALTAHGLSVSGIELGSFEDVVAMIKAGDPAAFGVVFFPMHRIERVELDLADGNIPSLSQRFAAKTELNPVSVLTAGLSARFMSTGDIE
jgi:hypothetical protein